MTFLLLAILCTTLLGFILKCFSVYGIDVLQAIVINYFVCVICAGIHTSSMPITLDLIDKPWFPYALAIGLLFISSFNLLGIAFEKIGLTIPIITQKMSLILIVIFTIVIYEEAINGLKILGILAALFSIVLVNQKDKEADSTINFQGSIMLASIFLLSGTADCILTYVERSILSQSGDPIFIATCFFTAGSCGLLLMLFDLLKGHRIWKWQNLVGGLILGIVNYFSLITLLKAIGSELDGSFVFPVLNVSVISASAVLAYVCFNEKLNAKNILGILLSLGAIILVALGTWN